MSPYQLELQWVCKSSDNCGVNTNHLDRMLLLCEAIEISIYI
jgi:hypothetical protein